MKKLTLLLIGLLTIGTTTYASDLNSEETSRRYANYDGSKYVFVEAGIEFSVFPDGEFDFYIPRYADGVSVGVNAGPVSISFNTGFNYDPYIQYDEYGAVIQIEDTPLYYDNYGRLTQAGDVDVRYNNNRIVRVGGLFVNYNRYGAFDYSSGFINVYNRTYIYRPFHAFFYRPIFNRCLVWNTPYRTYYNPIRYNYAFHRNNYNRGYRNGYANARRDNWKRPNTGRVAHNNGRRDNVDRNNVRFNKPTTRGIAQAGRLDKNTRGVARPNTARGTARPNNSRGTAKPNNSRGTAKPNNSRGTARANNSRGTAKANNSRGAARPSNSRGTAKPNTSRVKQKASSSSRGTRNSSSKATRSSTSRSSAASKASRSSKRSGTSSKKRSSSRTSRG